ncbi:MAG: choice-of-anchor J domain-containing protein, partial [Lutibacter sp.]
MHPGPQGNTLRWVKMMDSTNWYACGYAGTFMKSSNAGASWSIYTNAGGWQPSYYGQGRILYSGWFFNLNTGLVCGSSGWIARTTNGGLNWDSIASPTTSALYGLHFVSSTVGFIGGASGTVLKTTDAGLTWTALTTGITTTIYNIYAVDANNIFAPTTVGNVRVTTDGGTTWATSYTGSSYTVYDANFINANTGMVCGSSGNAKFTSNGGLNWTSVTTPTTTTKYELSSKVTSSSPSTPYSEGFESTTFPPTGWQAVNVLGTSTWVRATDQYHSGTASAYITYETSGGEDWLITPKWTIATGDSLAFWWKNNFSSAYPPDSLIIKVSTTDSSLSSFTTTILAINSSLAPYTWTRVAASLNAFAGQSIYIAFRHKNTDGNGGYLDDVAVNRQGQMTPAFYVAGDSYGIYKTVDNGANWTLLPYDTLVPWTSTHYSLDVSGSRIFVGGAYGMLEKSTNEGATFSALHHWISAGTKYDAWAQYNNGKVIVVG